MVEITLGLPCYNEAGNIHSVLAESAGHLDRFGRPWEMIVVDNHSSDNTAERVRDFIRAEPRAKLIEHDCNRFYSGSCKTILKHAQGRYVAIMDSDGQFTAEDVSTMVRELERGANLVLGWRRERHDPWTRKIMSKVFQWMARYWLGFPHHDLNVGLRMLDRRFMENLTIRHTINMVNPELYAHARRHGLTVTEVPIRHSERIKGATSHNFANLFKLLREVIAYFRSLSRELKQAPHIPSSPSRAA